MVQPVMRFIRGKTRINLAREPIGLGCPAAAVVFLEHLNLQCRFVRESLGEFEPLFGLVHIQPRERRIAAHQALLVIEDGAVGLGVEL